MLGSAHRDADMLTMESIDELAARWAVRVAARPLTQDEEHELQAWLSASPRHLGAYVRARAQWTDLNRLAALQGPASRGEDASAGQVVASAGHIAVEVEDPRRQSRRRLLVAGLAAIGIAGGGLSYLQFRTDSTRYVSGIGEIRRLSLDDGSTMLLNTASDATVEFNKGTRHIRLIKGEALFEVAHDKARPFIVMAHDAAVRAVGTAFAVRVQPGGIDLTVTEGVVQLTNLAGAPTTASSRESLRVAATERVEVIGSRVQGVRRLTAAQTERLLAWREGLVAFDGESMQAAAAEVNRHNRRQIVIQDPVLAAKPIVGVFRANDAEGFSRAAAAVLKAKAIDDGQSIRLEPDVTQRGK